MTIKSPHEAVGTHFSRDKLIRAQSQANAAVQKIASLIKPGMMEEDARTLTKNTLTQLGMEREWHPTLIRFGNNTAKTFREPSEPNTQLQENDIFFVDIGPVFEGHEGDSGATFTVGHHPEMIACAEACTTLFESVKQHWLSAQPSGKALYAYAEQQAEALGWKLNLGAPGHRVGDFPHAIHKADHLAKLEHTPSANLWILEIQIRHPMLPFGAFYEDLLV